MNLDNLGERNSCIPAPGAAVLRVQGFTPDTVLKLG